MHTKINIISYHQAQLVGLPCLYEHGNLSAEDHQKLQQRLANKKPSFQNNQKNKELITKVQKIKAEYERFLQNEIKAE